MLFPGRTLVPSCLSLRGPAPLVVPSGCPHVAPSVCPPVLTPVGAPARLLPLVRSPSTPTPFPGRVPSLAPHQPSGGTLFPRRYPTPTWPWECPSSKTLVTAQVGFAVCLCIQGGGRALSQDVPVHEAGFAWAAAPRPCWPLGLLAQPGAMHPHREASFPPHPSRPPTAPKGLSALMGGLRSISAKHACQKARVLWGLQASCHMVSRFVPKFGDLCYRKSRGCPARVGALASGSGEGQPGEGRLKNRRPRCTSPRRSVLHRAGH